MSKTVLSQTAFIRLVIILSCLCITYANRSGNHKSKEVYTWRVEDWRNCVRAKSCKEPGIRRRSLACVDSNGENTSLRKCDRKTRPKRKELCVAEECINQTIFKLKLWRWRTCKPEPLSGFHVPNVLGKNSTIETKMSNNSFDEYNYLQHESNWKASVIDSCGSFDNTLIYVKRRNISCTAHWPKKNSYFEAEIGNCLKFSKEVPKSIQLCSFGCKQKCSVGLWSDWEASPLLPEGQTFRKREITYFPYFNEGLDICPDVFELGGKGGILGVDKRGSQLEFSTWSSCKVNERGKKSSELSKVSGAAVVGVQTRDVTCVTSKGLRMRCLKNSSVGAQKNQACVLPRDCQVTEWTEWSNCYAVLSRRSKEGGANYKIFYQRRRTRNIVLTRLPPGKECPLLIETKLCQPLLLPLYEQRRKNGSIVNDTFEWFVGEFGRCQSDKKDCRSGIKTRSVFCVRRGDTRFNPVGSQYCAHKNKPLGEAFCSNPCRETCVLGEWNSWSGCMADCDRNARGIVRGTYYRVRRVIQYSGDPRSCEDYAESRPCTLRNCVSWVAGTQTICLLDNIHRACGNGKTHRAVYCMNAKGQQVDESLCQEKMPARSLPCHVPCSDDCVVGTWSNWGSCEGICGKNGTQGESYRKRKRTILAYPGWSGRPCPSSSEMVETDSCLGENCGTYHWKVEIWGTCKVKPSGFGTRIVKDRQNRVCRIGILSRLVLCVNNGGEKVNDYLCSTFLKPQEEKECRLCAENCMLSPWSEWSSCPSECRFPKGPDQFFRKRQRYIIREGRDGGKLCPVTNALLQSEECASCDEYQWKLSSWSRCVTPPGENCKGLKTRHVFCVRKSGSKVEPDGFCLSNGEKPREVSSCTKNCVKRCVLTEWSSWKDCSKACGSGYSRRTRQTVGNSISCDPNTRLSEERACNTHECGQYSLRSGAWSQCYPKDVNKGCGAGLQWRNVTCFRLSGSEAPLQYCIEELYGGKITLSFERSCMVSCPLDCKLSSWTAYTPCSRKCGSGVKTRFRTIVQKATHGGQMCASDDDKKQITETVPCLERECFNFVWKTDPWEACKITNQTIGRITKCGTGLHQRKVYCTDKRFSGSLGRVNDSLCDAEEKPVTEDSCTMYCPGDCVVGQWTTWSKCSSTCPRPGHRRRERTVLRYPAHDGKNCPVLERYQACNMKHCYTHHWRTTTWSSCSFYTDDASCGVGTQRRMADCVRSDGKIMHPFHCRVEGRRVPALLRKCSVPCPRNCEISEWGAWSTCKDGCNMISVQRRERFVLARAEHGGQSCLESDSLQEFRSCPMRPCYNVKVGAWGDCVPGIEKGCGYGTKRRSVNCLRDDGKIMDNAYCLQSTSGLYPKEVSCKVPCHSDCLITDWSHWTSCFGSCTVKNESIFNYGTRLRTRHVLQEPKEFGEKCSRNLVQNERCSNPACFTFSWKTGPYTQKKRDVWCERSDGLLVSSGCHFAYMPSTTQSCEPKCKVTHSFCNSKTICACKKDYIPIFSSHGHLIHCLADSNAFRNGTKENETTVSRSSNGKKDASWFGDLPIIIWVVIGVCFVYFLLFLAIVIVYTRRRKNGTQKRRADTADVGTLTNPERIPLTEQKTRHERTESKTSFATSSGRGSTLSTISDHDDGEQWPEPPDDVVAEFIRQHLKNFNTSSLCSTFSEESLAEKSKAFGSPRGTSFDAAGTL